MLQTEKKRFRNRLSQIRKQRGLRRKQVAALLGHENVTELARMERGLGVPDLRCALKLAQIYKLPVRVMLDEYYAACREEIGRQESLITGSGLKTKHKEAADAEYCTYEQRLNAGFLNEERLREVRRHDEVMARVPDNRIRDVVLFDPADEKFPIGFNILQANSETEKNFLASDLVATFRSYSTSWGDVMDAVLANAVQAFVESRRGGTLFDLKRFLVEKEFRREFLETAPHLPHVGF